MGEALLSIVIKNPVLFEERIKEINLGPLDLWITTVISKLAEEDLTTFSFDNFVKKFGGDEAMKLEFAYLRSQELWREFSDKDLLAEFINIIKRIKHRTVISKLASLEYEIKEAENEKNRDKVLELINRFTNLTKELTEINNV